jgi:hypothetical protein
MKLSQPPYWYSDAAPLSLFCLAGHFYENNIIPPLFPERETMFLSHPDSFALDILLKQIRLKN